MYNLLWQQQKINKGTFSWKNAIFIYEKSTHIPCTALSAMPTKAKPLTLKVQLRTQMQNCTCSVVSLECLYLKCPAQTHQQRALWFGRQATHQYKVTPILPQLPLWTLTCHTDTHVGILKCLLSDSLFCLSLSQPRLYKYSLLWSTTFKCNTRKSYTIIFQKPAWDQRVPSSGIALQESNTALRLPARPHSPILQEHEKGWRGWVPA